MEDTNKYLILTENDGRYKVSANTWQEALIKYYKYCGTYGEVNVEDFIKLIQTRNSAESIKLINYLQQHDDDIECFFRIGGEFVSYNIVDLDNKEDNTNATNK